LLVDKNLFQNTGTGAELTWTMTYPPSIGKRHVLALGARNAVGHTKGAYIPSPPDSIIFHEVLQQTHGEDGFGYYTCQGMPDPPGTLISVAGAERRGSDAGP
jgi:hypothetical protein